MRFVTLVSLVLLLGPLQSVAEPDARGPLLMERDSETKNWDKPNQILEKTLSGDAVFSVTVVVDIPPKTGDVKEVAKRQLKLDELLTRLRTDLGSSILSEYTRLADSSRFLFLSDKQGVRTLRWLDYVAKISVEPASHARVMRPRHDAAMRPSRPLAAAAQVGTTSSMQVSCGTGRQVVRNDSGWDRSLEVRRVGVGRTWDQPSEEIERLLEEDVHFSVTVEFDVAARSAATTRRDRRELLDELVDQVKSDLGLTTRDVYTRLRDDTTFSFLTNAPGVRQLLYHDFISVLRVTPVSAARRTERR